MKNPLYWTPAAVVAGAGSGVIVAALGLPWWVLLPVSGMAAVGWLYLFAYQECVCGAWSTDFTSLARDLRTAYRDSVLDDAAALVRNSGVYPEYAGEATRKVWDASAESSARVIESMKGGHGE